MKLAPATFNDGTIWLLSGTNHAGLTLKVKTFGEGTFTFYNTLSNAVVAGIKYAAVNNQFTFDQLLEAVNYALGSRKSMMLDTTLTGTGTQEEFDLPSGVSDVRRVEIAKSTSEPYGYARSYYWQEIYGHLMFYSNVPASGMPIRIWYAGYHPEVEYDDDINPAIDEGSILWGAAVYLYRNLIEKIRKDNPTATELLNEANSRMQEAQRKSSAYARDMINHDPLLGTGI